MRFTGPRGISSTVIWSDHGMNFFGAKTKIHRLLQQDEKIRSRGTQVLYLTQNRIKVYTLAYATLWRTIKSHLSKMLGEARLNLEKLSTILVQVEACLNCHPLTPLPEASDILKVLTPGRFLNDRPLAALPEESEHQVIKPLRRWQLCQSLARHL